VVCKKLGARFVSKKVVTEASEIVYAEWTQVTPNGEYNAKLHKTNDGYRLVIDGPQGRIINNYPAEKFADMTQSVLSAAGMINIVIKYA